MDLEDFISQTQGLELDPSSGNAYRECGEYFDEFELGLLREYTKSIPFCKKVIYTLRTFLGVPTPDSIKYEAAVNAIWRGRRKS